jgi:hypothetical protein
MICITNGFACRAAWRSLLVALLLLIGTRVASADEVQVQGIGELSYETGLFSRSPDAGDRQRAIELAKKNALDRYTASFSASRYQLYQKVESQVLSSLDQYVVDAMVLDEGVDKAGKKYHVVVRATINGARLDELLTSAPVARTGAPGIALSYLFVARQTDSVREFQARKTSITNSQQGTTASGTQGVSGAAVSYSESAEQSSVTTTGGSTLRKADQVEYVVTSPEDVNTAMLDVFSSNGFQVYDYRDIVAQCGGVDPDRINAEFAKSDQLSRETRKGAFAAARSCSVTVFAIGTLDIGLQDVDPVSGNKRVYVSVRSQVMSLIGALPRVIASVGPVQYAGLGPDQQVARRNALQLAATEVAKTISDQLRSKGFQ